jgi:outer membrane protein TolC
MSRLLTVVTAALVLLVQAVLADDSRMLPNPLTLDDALRFASPDRPVLALAHADRRAAEAAIAEAEAITGLRVSAYGTLRAIRPSYRSLNPDNNDSSAQLAVRKRLYDFGYSDAREQAARRGDDGSRWRLLAARQLAHLDVMERFFDVILADLTFARDDQAMALAFIDADRARDRHELQQLSDVDLLELEATYRHALQRRMHSQAQQRATRSRLAIAMGRPGQLASDVVRPEPPDINAKLPDYEVLLEQAMSGNPELRALRAEVSAAKAALVAAQNRHGPVLSGELEASVYNRMTNSTHPLGAALVLEVPLATGGARDAEIAGARAELQRRRAELALAEQTLTQQVLDLRLRLDKLRVEMAGLDVRRDYRELYLDRSRALYELEVEADLGDAMTEITSVTLDTARAEFDWMLTNAEIAAIGGRLLGTEPAP